MTRLEHYNTNINFMTVKLLLFTSHPSLPVKDKAYPGSIKKLPLFILTNGLSKVKLFSSFNFGSLCLFTVVKNEKTS